MKVVHTIWRPAAAALVLAGLVGTAAFAARQNPTTLTEVSPHADGPAPATAALGAINLSTGFETTDAPPYLTLGYMAHVNGFFPSGCGSVAAPCWGHTTGAGFSLITPTISNANPFAGTQHLRVTPDPSTRTNQPNFGLGVDARYPRTAFLSVAPVVPNTVNVEVSISNGFGQDFRVQPQSNSQGFLATSALFHYAGGLYILDDLCGTVGLGFQAAGMWDTSGAYQNYTVVMNPCNNTIEYYYGGVLVYTGCVFAGSNLEQFLIFGDNYPGSTMDVDNLVMETSPWTECPTDCDGDGILDDLETNPAERDCDRDGVCNGVEIANCTPGDLSCADCNGNSIPDGCESDCNNNQIADSCDIANCPPGDLSCADCNSNGIPDGCEQGACCGVSVTTGTAACVNTTQAQCALLNPPGTFLGACEVCPPQSSSIAYHGSNLIIHTVGVPVACPGFRNGGVAVACNPGDPKFDPWVSKETDENNPVICHNFGAVGGGPIPAGFFGPGSDPFGGIVCLQGVPLGPTAFGDFGDADTIIERSADPFDRCDLPPGAETTVDIEIVALSLVSIQPITVTFNGGQSPDEHWNMAVDLSTVTPPAGTLTATKTHCNGGKYTSVLPVQPRFTFTEVGVSGDLIFDTGLAGLDPVILRMPDLNAPNVGTWVHDVHPNLGAVLDVCSDFHAGIQDDILLTTCDCNNNGVRDKCDIETLFSEDCNLNGIPDSCDLFTCNDSNPCTDDLCTFGVGCQYEYNTLPCDDGNACTTDDACSAGACVSGPPLDCDDDNVCTDDSCDPSTGCMHVDNTAPCNDANACTTNDTCSTGACAGGAPLDCDDGNACTDDSCDPGTGCMHMDNAAPCDDGLFCTINDTCGGGACSVTNPNLCSDGVDCTDDACVEANDSCTHVVNNILCDDGLFCTGVETCNLTLGCQNGPPPCTGPGQVCYEEKDACFDNIIPTVSEWGLVILTLLLLTGAKIYFSRRQATA